MRKLSKIIITCILFLGITTIIYATTDILPENRFGIKKVAILVAGIFLVIQILFIAYQKDTQQALSNQQEYATDKIQEKIDEIFSIEELEKFENEEKNLFSSLDIEKKIETLPDKMAPQKRNIKLKKETIIVKEKNQDISENKEKIITRKDVKIVRERKKRNKILEDEVKQKKKKAEVEIKKNAIKAEGEAKKIATKAKGEIKKKEAKLEVEEKKKNTKNKKL